MLNSESIIMKDVRSLIPITAMYCRSFRTNGSISRRPLGSQDAWNELMDEVKQQRALIDGLMSDREKVREKH